MKKALACTYYSSSQQLIGFTTPTAYDIHDEPTPRLDVSAQITQPTCGFDLTGEFFSGLRTTLNLEFQQPLRISVSVKQMAQPPSHLRSFNGKLLKPMDQFLTSQIVQKKLLTFHSIFHLLKILLVPPPNGEKFINYDS